MIEQAVILCAGLGSRLRPFTDTAPKPMLPILGVPMIEWNIQRFAEFGVKRFLINLHYLPDVLTSYLGDGSRWGVQIDYHFEPTILGTAGGVKAFERQLDPEFFLLYGDVFSRMDYGAMERKWRELGAGLGMQRMRRTDAYADADVVEVDPSDRVVAVHPKPHVREYPHACRMAGIFILASQIISGVPADQYCEIGKDLLPCVVKQGGEFWGYFCSDYSKGIDTLEKKGEVEAYLNRSGVSIQQLCLEGSKAVTIRVENSRTPVVTVIMATYNRSSVIGNAIESVVNQSFTDWELVIADDGSTDATAQVLRNWEGRDGRIRYLPLAHAGRISIVSNSALEAARGKYIAILDDDDAWIDPRKLEKQVNFLESHPEFAACAGGYSIVNGRGERVEDIYKPETDEAIRHIALRANPIANSTAMFRRDLGAKYNPVLRQFADWDFWLDIGKLGKLYNFPELFLAYRVWDQGSSFVNQRANARAAVHIVRRHRGSYPGYRQAILMARTYVVYSYLPLAVRMRLNSFLSRLKKRMFARRS